VFYGLIVWLTEGQQRMALAFVGVFFMIALGLLSRIDMQRGVNAAMVSASFSEKI
jgi:hypothetical protein